MLEHVADDYAMLSELLAAASPGCYFLLTVPADESLWSEHDESFGHYRRYDRARLEGVWAGLPVTTLLVSYFNSRLLPIVRLVRAWNRRRGRAAGRAGTDFWLPSRPANALLTAIFAGEAGRLVAALRGRTRAIAPAPVWWPCCAERPVRSPSAPSRPACPPIIRRGSSNAKPGPGIRSRSIERLPFRVLLPTDRARSITCPNHPARAAGSGSHHRGPVDHRHPSHAARGEERGRGVRTRRRRRRRVVRTKCLSPSCRSKPGREERSDKSREVKNIRVDITRLDQMMNLIEDLVINRGRLAQIARKFQIKELDETLNMVGRSVSDLQNLMMNIRMIPLSHIFNRFPRTVRDLAHKEEKEVDFTIEGGDTELDRSIMDGLNDPLLHLIRNAVDHGIEKPEIRIKSGNPEKGI